MLLTNVDSLAVIDSYKNWIESIRCRVNGDFKIKFLVTSRPYGDIERRFSDVTRQFPSIHLAEEEEWRYISQEIDMVINAKGNEFTIERDLVDDIGGTLKSWLSGAQNRTFLWLHLTQDFLRGFHGHTKVKPLREMEKLPETVVQAYGKILQRCNSRY